MLIQGPYKKETLSHHVCTCFYVYVFYMHKNQNNTYVQSLAMYTVLLLMFCQG